MRGSVVKDTFSVVTDIPPGTTGKQAEKELRNILVELEEHRYVEPSSRTLEAYPLEDWLPARGNTIRPGTLRIYRQVITGCLLPHALNATACIRGGVQPGLRSDAGWSHTRLWSYAVC